MQPRHAAALALVGGHLMLPPSLAPKVRGGDVVWHKDAPFSQWSTVQSFDTAAGCEIARAERLKSQEKSCEVSPQWVLAEVWEIKETEAAEDIKREPAIRKLAQGLQKDFHTRCEALFPEMWRSGLCVASDDPRLKEK